MLGSLLEGRTAQLAQAAATGPGRSFRIVAEAEEPGVRIAEVAARHEVYPSLLFMAPPSARRSAGPQVPAAVSFPST